MAAGYDGTFEEYDGATNAMIEKAYVQFRESGFQPSTTAGPGAGTGAGAGAGAGAGSHQHIIQGTSSVTVSTSPHRIVTFARMHQVNAGTGVARNIRRKTQHEFVVVHCCCTLVRRTSSATPVGMPQVSVPRHVACPQRQLQAGGRCSRLGRVGTCSHAADSLCHGCNTGTPATVRVVNVRAYARASGSSHNRIQRPKPTPVEAVSSRKAPVG